MRFFLCHEQLAFWTRLSQWHLELCLSILGGMDIHGLAKESGLESGVKHPGLRKLSCRFIAGKVSANKRCNPRSHLEKQKQCMSKKTNKRASVNLHA